MRLAARLRQRSVGTEDTRLTMTSGWAQALTATAPPSTAVRQGGGMTPVVAAGATGGSPRAAVTTAPRQRWAPIPPYASRRVARTPRFPSASRCLLGGAESAARSVGAGSTGSAPATSRATLPGRRRQNGIGRGTRGQQSSRSGTQTRAAGPEADRFPPARVIRGGSLPAAGAANRLADSAGAPPPAGPTTRKTQRETRTGRTRIGQPAVLTQPPPAPLHPAG